MWEQGLALGTHRRPRAVLDSQGTRIARVVTSLPGLSLGAHTPPHVPFPGSLCDIRRQHSRAGPVPGWASSVLVKSLLFLETQFPHL